MDFHERLIREQSELQIKINSLAGYLRADPKPGNPSDHQLSLLYQQWTAMQSYNSILLERLATL